MKSNSETGHAMNVANFKEAISIITAYGTVYNPSNDAIKLPGLQTALINAETAIGQVSAALPSYSIAIGNREAAFAPLSGLVTRVLNALKAIVVIPQVVKSAKSITLKIQGRRVTPKLTAEEKAALEAEGKEVKEISASQMSFDMRLDNFNKLIVLLADIPLYTPNEAELSVEGLTTLYNDLTAKNAAVISATTTLSNARIARNKVLYDQTTGLCQLAASTKAYAKSLFGTKSPQYKQIAKLPFKTIKA
jgi:hypothetical protein